VASAEVVAGFATTGRHLAETPKVCLEEVSAQLVVIHPLDNHTSWPAIV